MHERLIPEQRERLSSLASHADLGSVRAQVSEVIVMGSDTSAGELPLTPRAAQVLHLTRREAEMYEEKHIPSCRRIAQRERSDQPPIG